MINFNVMSKYLGLVAGIVAVIFGVRGLIAWRGDLFILLRGSLPAVLILGGAIAIVAAYSEIKDETASKRGSKE